MGAILSAHGLSTGRRQLLELYAEIEPEVQAGPFQNYRSVLQQTLELISARLGIEPDPLEVSSFPDSIRNWQPFPDTVEALKALKRKYRLAIISNIDDDLFAYSVRHLEVEFDGVITAQQVGAYKPSTRNFEVALERLDVSPRQVLHVAQSIYHDVVPAGALGLATVWVNRRHGQPGAGATRAVEAEPDLEVPDLFTLAVKMGLGAQLR